MKLKILNLVVLFFSSLVVFAQNKQIDKIAALYKSEAYEECVEKADAYSEKDDKTPEPYFYSAEAKFEIFKNTVGINSDNKLKNAIRATYKAVAKDNDSIVQIVFKDFLSELKDTLLVKAKYYYYNTNQGETKDYEVETKFYYEYIAKIYKDTTDEYIHLFLPKRVPVVQDLAFGTFTGPVNQVDMTGKKQGVWLEYYDSKVVKSEINFVNGLPVGTFRKYYENGKLKANMVFDETSKRSSAILYDERGNKVAMGFYENKQKDSLWQYFIMDSILFMSEKYNKGALNGTSRLYYGNSVVMEEKNYKNGVLDGNWRRYFTSGQEEFETKYVNGKLDGPYIKYYTNGVLNISGRYKNDEKDGTWYFFDNMTDKKLNIEYVDGVAKNQAELDLEENKLFKEMEENRNLLTEPDFFRDAPRIDD